MTKLLIFGTFDGLHEGHLNFFKQAKENGDYLVVVVGRDANVERIKKRLPKQDQFERLEAVKRCGLADEARLGNEGVDYYKVIGEVKPDVICLGYDQFTLTDKLEQKIKEMGLTIEIKRMKPFKPEIYHSSLLTVLDEK